MKKHSLILFLLFVLGCMMSCTPKQNFTSPLEGVSIADQILEFDELTKTIEVQSYMNSVSAVCTDASTNETCNWLKVSTSKGCVKLELTENATICDRKAKVKLTATSDGEEVYGNNGTLVFFVTQKKNGKFDGIEIDELSLTFERCDTTIELARELSNVKTEVLPLDSGDVKWCTARVAGELLTVKVEENKSKGSRQALVKISPKTKEASSDSVTAKVMFLVTQYQNPILDSLAITPVVLTYEGKAQVVKTNRQLTGIKAQVVDNDTHTRASWCTATVAGDSITVKATELTSLTERSAQVILYLPNHGEVIDSTTITSTFMVTQKHNTVFDGVNIPNATLHYDQTRVAFKVTLPENTTMRNIKSIVKDPNTSEAITWLKVSAAGDSIVLTAQVHKDKTDRSAHVTLYYPSGQTIDANTIKTDFTVKQMHNTVFDNIKIDPVELKHNETRHVFKLPTQMKGISAKTTDPTTGNEVKWVTAKAAGDSVVLTTSVYCEGTSRKAKITLYYPNGKDISDSSVVKDSFNVAQLHNTVFDDATPVDIWHMDWNQTESTFPMKHPLTDIKCRLIDMATNATPKWLSVTIEGRNVIFKSEVNKGLTSRNAEVILYYPNGKNYEDSQVKYGFQLQQGEMQQLSVATHKVEADYTNQRIELTVMSNVDFDCSVNPSWMHVGYRKSGDNEYKVELELFENKTDEVRKGVLTLIGKNNHQVKDSVVVTQKTNPKITLFDGITSIESFGKDGGEFMLPVHTLTPNYKIVKKASWISVGSQQRDSQGLYYHKITVQSYIGDGPLRHDTIVVKNDNQQASFVVEQHKYLALKENEKEVEVGTHFQLVAVNYTSQPMEWSSSNTNVATVDQNGYVVALARGTADISVSIGEFNEVKNYHDNCKVKVYNAYDKVSIKRGLGDYQKSDGFVTANCPVVVTNNYHQPITLESIEIVGDNGATIKSSTNFPGNKIIENGKNYTASFENVDHVYQPKVVVKFSVNGMEYEKKVDY